MESTITKYFVLICILQFARSINSQDSEKLATTEYVFKNTSELEQVPEGVIEIIEVTPEPSESNEDFLFPEIAINENPITEIAADDAIKLPSTETIEVQTWITTNDFSVVKSSTDSDIIYELSETIDNTDKVENNVIEVTTTNPQALVTVDVNPSTATPNNLKEEDTTEDNFEKSETTAAAEASNTEAPPEIPKNVTPLKPCSEVGVFPHETNCYSYYTCIEATNGLQRVDHACPIKSAFNDELKRCARDISFCDGDDQACLVAGSYEDTQSNATYYKCVPRLTGGFHKYRIDCGTGEVFFSQLGKCFIDMNNLQNLPINFGQDNGQLDDEHIVKMELKEFKSIEKAKFKAQKLKDKFEKKLQEQLAKKAAKDAKEKSKAEKSKEKENFICAQEGNYASTLNENRYFSCINKKGKLKALNMICPAGHGFDQESGACILKVNVPDDDSNDDDSNDN